MSGRRIDVSATQVIASLLAAVTGAVAASTLGVAGTIIGTAVMSVASTAVAAIYKHYIGTSRERLRKAAESARVSPLMSGGAGAAIRARHRATEPGHTTPTVTATETDAEKTQVLPVVSATQHRWHDADRANGFGRPDEATQLMSSGANGAQGPEDHTQLMSGGSNGARGPEDHTQLLGERSMAGAEAGHAMAGEPTRPAEVRQAGTAGGETRTDGPAATRDGTAHGAQRDGAGGPRWRRPLMLAGVAVGIFLLAMAGITAFEAAAGKPLDAIVAGKHNSGTTVGSVLGGQSAHTVTHRTSPTPTPTPTATPTRASSASPSPTPTTTPTPTPSPTPSPTPASTSGATSAPTPHASARPAATANPAG
jgi:cell division septation protein DedD